MNPCVTLLLISEQRRSDSIVAPLWFLRVSALLRSFIHLSLVIGDSGHFDPSVSSHLKLSQFGWRPNSGLSVVMGWNSEP